MRLLGILFITGLLMASCVPAKKYNELLAKEQQCSEDLKKHKSDALNYEAQAKDFRSRYEMAAQQLDLMKDDTTRIGKEYRTLRAKYERLAAINESLETNYDKLRLSGAQDVAKLNAELDAKKVDLQRREDELAKLEEEMTAKQKRIAEQEAALSDLNALIKQQEAASKALKDRVTHALRNFKSKGLSIEERDGKIYVSLEAKLLFASGSTAVQAEGKTALVELAKVLETEKDLEIIVEGHTDTDKMASSRHPKNNWELSVLRATSVISILLENSEMDPQQLMAAGRSEFHPVDPEDKAKNRRIEIIISPNLDELYELISE